MALVFLAACGGDDGSGDGDLVPCDQLSQQVSGMEHVQCILPIEPANPINMCPILADIPCAPDGRAASCVDPFLTPIPANCDANNQNCKFDVDAYCTMLDSTRVTQEYRVYLDGRPGMPVHVVGSTECKFQECL